MKREVIENINEKDFVASLIMSDKCCQILLDYVKPTYFDIDYSRVIVSWVSDYYKKFKIAPKKDVTSIYKSRCDEIQDEALKDLIYNYLKNIAESEININNEDYLVDRGKDFIDYKALQEYTENLQACLDTRDMAKARKVQQDYKKINTTEVNEVSLLSLECADRIARALSASKEILFTLPENMNKVFGNIHREDFIAVLAPPKRGKSFMLQYIAIQALMQRLNVVYVSMEMNIDEVVQRLWKTLFGTKSGLVSEGLYESCRFIECPDEEGKYHSELIDVNVKTTDVGDIKTYQKQLKAMTQYQGNLRILSYPRFNASVETICNRVEELAKDGFVADVVIIDYADITTPIGGGSELRNQLDEIWKYLGGFAMKFHCAMITASQTNRSGLSANVVGGETIGENFKKLAHITSMVSLEQTPKMRKEHIMRIRNIAVRNDEVEETCVFPQCLKVGQFVFGEPILGKDFIFENGEDDEEDE